MFTKNTSIFNVNVLFSDAFCEIIHTFSSGCAKSMNAEGKKTAVVSKGRVLSFHISVCMCVCVQRWPVLGIKAKQRGTSGRFIEVLSPAVFRVRVTDSWFRAVLLSYKAIITTPVLQTHSVSLSTLRQRTDSYKHTDRGKQPHYNSSNAGTLVQMHKQKHIHTHTYSELLFKHFNSCHDNQLIIGAVQLLYLNAHL